MLIKFKQLEDTKEATRSLISYQKHYHALQTQNLINENLMELKVCRDDKNFLKAQRKMYAKF